MRQFYVLVNIHGRDQAYARDVEIQKNGRGILQPNFVINLREATQMRDISGESSQFH